VSIDAQPQPAYAQPANVGDEVGSPQSDLTQLALQFQDPISSLIGQVTFENDTNFNIGPHARVQNTLVILPVFPVHVGEYWNVISRTIVPLVWLPDVAQPSGETFGLSDSTQSFYLTPAHHGVVTWGIGPILYLPTATARVLGTGHWGLGPTAAVIAQPKSWTFGILASHIWSVVGPSDRTGVKLSSAEVLVAANLPKGWYINTSPFVASADWNAGPTRDIWTIPIGGGFGKVALLDGHPIDMQVGAYWNVLRPKDIPTPAWQLRVQLAWLFPR
jgi:hypothetical protein